MTRLTSTLVVSAIMRRVFSAGGFAAVLSKGSEEAGAIFIISRDRAGHAHLYGPAPQTDYESEGRSERRFRLLARIENPWDDAIETRMERERRFDPDLWLVEIDGGPEIGDLVDIVSTDD